MKIVVVQDWLRSGGTERQSVLLANAFAAAGHETTLVTFRPGGALAGTVGQNVRREVLQPFDTRLDWFAPGLTRRVERAAPDIVLCMGRMANCYAGGLQRVLGRKNPTAAVIATMRTGKPLPSLFRRSLGLARHVVANSRDAARTLKRRYGVAPERVTVIHNSLVFGAAADGQRERLRRQQGAQEHTLVLLCVAMFRPEKNQRELVAIAAGLPETLDWQLWLAGEGPARAECERLAQQRHLGGRVKFLGFQRDPTGLYAASDVAVHASGSESLSNFLIEAQAHGIPCAAYAAQGIEECFVPGETGWVFPRDDRAGFRERLVLLARANADERTRRAAQARAYARETFDAERQVNAYLELFARLRSPTAAEKSS